MERGAAVVDLVAASSVPLTAAEIARDVGLAKSTAHGLLAGLCTLGLLVRRGDQCYVLGPRLARWGQAFEAQADVAQEFARIWDEGASLPGATITLSVLEGNEVVYIATRNSDQTPWVDFRVGMRLPLAYTATGMAFMACMKTAEIKQRLGDTLPPALTPYSAKSLDEVLALAALARENGYSFDDQQVCEGMVCFGAPVLDAQDRPIAAVAVSLPLDDLDERGDGLTRDVQAIARRLSQRMGAQV